MALSRRGFLRLVAAAGASLGAGGALRRLLGKAVPAASEGQTIPAFAADASRTGQLVAGTPAASVIPPLTVAPAPPESRGRRWVMVIDLARCDGCRKCTDACTAMHFVPFGQEWIKVYANRDNEVAGAYWFPRPCMQCDNPPCVKVCPVGATYKRADGIVIQNQDVCIGCRYCMAACPYSARYFNWVEPPHTPEETARPYSLDWNYPHRKGVAAKCIFCPALLREGKLAACAAACPMGAIYMGDENEDTVTNSQGETVRFSALVRDNGGHRYLEELGTEPRVYYLPPRNRQYPAPPEPAATKEGGR
ncbi:MAG: 4Fe-4S dicluster domain-containing protein [Armatimonadetes bacterium]|nr:4Fe-4S dicluster domain-containing protein [Armatimonadota bacterium]